MNIFGDPLTGRQLVPDRRNNKENSVWGVEENWILSLNSNMLYWILLRD